MKRTFCSFAALLVVFLTIGCDTYGPRQIPVDRFDYNTAIAASAQEQMLLNLVRLRFGEVPTFLAVNSVLTQYVWTGEAGIAGGGGEIGSVTNWTVGGNANVRYIERPTVTYSPLSGQEFAAQLLNPVRADVVFSLVSSGWPPEQLLSTTIHRINDAENIGFADPMTPPLDRSHAFNRTIELIVELARNDAIELVRVEGDGEAVMYLELRHAPTGETAEYMREFRSILGLASDRDRFRITRRIVGRGPDEITIRMHSLLELMGLLSAGVDAPPFAAVTQQSTAAERSPSRSLVVRSQRERPRSAFVAVRYDNAWFYVPRDDERSKRAFGLLIYLFQMQASQEQGVGPLITVPVG